MADRTTEFLQIASGYLCYAPVPLQRLHVAELAKVLTICEKAFEMLNLAPFVLGQIPGAPKRNTLREHFDGLHLVGCRAPLKNNSSYLSLKHHLSINKALGFKDSHSRSQCFRSDNHQ